MRLIIDANIIIAALIKDSTVRKIILSGELELVAPSFTLEEIDAHIKEISRKTSQNSGYLHDLLKRLLNHVEIAGKEKTLEKLDAALEIMSKIDPSDAPYLSLAMDIKNDGIWSDDGHFKKQNKTLVFTTRDLLRLLWL